MPNTSKTSKNTSNTSKEKGLNLDGPFESRKKVYVGMSGGVDSSVSALLLKQAGYDVTGVFIKVWQPEDTDCGWKDERRDAMRVAAQLDIPFLTLDFSKEYKQEVVDYMISEYKAGRTPNPDIMCNRHIKFGSFLREALKRNVDYVATGHYAQNISFELQESEDKNKDQSYFLWTLTEKDLEHILFPVGHLQKSEVRRIAEEHSLPVFDKKDSQGVCFIGHLDMKEFLKENIDTRKGDVLNMQGTIIGEHSGAVLYTPGERHGFIIFNNTGLSEPHYVVSKDIKQNIVVVAPESAFKNNLNDHASKKAILSGVNIIGTGAFDSEKKYGVRIRYRQEKQACSIVQSSTKKGIKLELIFDTPQKGMAEGQSAVLYDGNTCLGGGILNLN